MSSRTPAEAGTVAPGAEARALLDRHRTLAARARAVLDHVDEATVRVASLVEADRDARVRAELGVVPVEQLGAMTDRNLRLRALAEAGYATAADLLGVPAATLDAVPGVGTQTARTVVAAVEQLAGAVRAGVPVRLEIDRSGRPDTATTVEVLRLLDRLLRLRPVVEPHREALAGYASAVAVHAASAEPATGRLRFALSRRATKDRARRALAALAGWDATLAGDASGAGDAAGTAGLGATIDRLAAACAVPDADAPALWDAFERRSAELYTVLGGIVPLAQDVLAARGMLTAELAERVAAHPLDLTAMRVPLRGYQEFGARFALNQGRALLGDEMGLGKTVQALAVMAHLAAGGNSRFLVVCPAGVLVNWLREVEARTSLAAHRLHGPGRDAALARWRAEGGVAVTTFEGLPHVPLDTAGVALLVVDEAHYVKNPEAQRSRAVAAWSSAVWRVLLLTGTPMDNRIEDFVALVRLLDADLAASLPPHLGLVGADTFRRDVAPVYLRRNQADVLVELPDLVLVDEWEDLSPAGERVYREAVASGNFMAMRRAAWLTPDPADSTKLGRLREIVAEAAENGQRTVVFSYFRDVLDVVATALFHPGGPPVFGPLTGDVPGDERQAEIDAFAAGPRDGVLVAQITVGGVGLNLQAASVAVLCEPQLTPAAEAQAVARLHRMGQVRAVVAHRLLAEDGVDERVVELLAGKRRVFDAYVRESSVAAAAVAAVDVTEAGLAREVVAMEQARLGYGPVWDELAAAQD
ncbi:DEAD/DEAH box helicase [Cellulomonas pakistanensis]|uniref:Helicase SNF2 n=1 Tax=Cellulomonas pakistanensis TaxID=992287 RepID=A0A919U6F3_9CELL|nr:DEAD/DEAH box helicase [Cellulomonas pakistanensis]GIG36205.1 helicase SNF2 [Cellulomonas pakistanensis]